MQKKNKFFWFALDFLYLCNVKHKDDEKIIYLNDGFCHYYTHIRTAWQS